MAQAKPRASYHHGDLPAALVAAAFELVEESGVQGFSVAEAARRTGVSISAPYRHFSDREDLLAACAVAAVEELKRRFDVELEVEPTPAGRLAAIAAAYVRFAAERRPMFEVLHGAGLEKPKYPRLETAATEALAAAEAAARELTPNGADSETGVLVQALTGLAQGHATLLLDGAFGEPPGAVDLAATRARAATAAMLRGRSLLFETPADG
ncbi:MAG TPA: helix-turn-helix domain-containing protein [Solirubrobacterales bacterium]|nr:helix-turn-helix domain-containing protein [Solirubrobacterales bacterium]